jgi:cobalt transporter subunit CbtA
MIAILRRILTAGLLAGVIAGLAFTAVQQVKVVPLILTAELYEDAAPAHGHGAAAGTHDQAGHDHAGHAHDADAWTPADGAERLAYTVLANILTGVGYGCILVAGMVFAGRALDWRRGLLWGLAGFAAFAVAPALGLPPELPGMAAADLAGRQLWWLATALASLAGLGLIIYIPAPYRIAAVVGGVALILLPHVVGAPEHAGDTGAVPAELAARFAIAALIAQAAFWAVLSGVAGHLVGRALPAAARSPRPAAA